MTTRPDIEPDDEAGDLESKLASMTITQRRHYFESAALDLIADLIGGKATSTDDDVAYESANGEH